MRRLFSILLIMLIVATVVLFSGCTLQQNKDSATYIGDSRTVRYDLVLDDNTNNGGQVYSYGTSDIESRKIVEDNLLSTMNNEKYRITSVQLYYYQSTQHAHTYNKGDISNFKLTLSEDTTKPSLRLKKMVPSDFLLKEGSLFIDKQAVGFDICGYLAIKDEFKNEVYYVFYIEPAKENS